MRVLFLSTDFKPRPGGIAELSYRIARGLAYREHQVLVCTNAVVEDDPALQQEPFVLRRAFAAPPTSSMRSVRGLLRNVWWHRSALGQIRHVVSESQPDIILLGNYHALWRGLLPGTGVPYAQYLHGEDLAAGLCTRVPGRAAAMRTVLRGASWLFCNSSYTASLLPRLLGASVDSVSVTGCGFPVEEIVDGDHKAEERRALGWDEAPTIVTVARLVPRKGIGTTIRALPTVLKAVPSCRYVIVGEGPDRGALERLVSELLVADHVRFLGYVSNRTRRSVYLASDLYVMPSHPTRTSEVEGFGISFLEANAHGLATVGSLAGGIPDAVVHRVNGLLVPPNDPGKLAAAMVELLLSPDLRAAMAEAGKQRIRDRFNWSVICDGAERRLVDAIAERAQGSTI